MESLCSAVTSVEGCTEALSWASSNLLAEDYCSWGVLCLETGGSQGLLCGRHPHGPWGTCGPGLDPCQVVFLFPIKSQSKGLGREGDVDKRWALDP